MAARETAAAGRILAAGKRPLALVVVEVWGGPAA